MRVLVPLKRVIDPYARVKPLADGSGIDTGGAKFEINPFDEIAIEEAVRLKEKGAVTEITLLTVDGSEAEEQLRKGLAIGADRAILVETSVPFDPPSVARELVAWIDELKPDLVLMGKQATDDDSNQVGQMLAALLEWPQATFASKIEPIGASLRVTRETDTGTEVVEVDLPAVVTTDLRLNEPRYIALPGIIKARSKPLEKQAARTAPRQKTRVLRFDPPPLRPPGRKVASVDELVVALRERGAI